MPITGAITFELTQPIRPRYINVTDGQTDRRTDREITSIQRAKSLTIFLDHNVDYTPCTANLFCRFRRGPLYTVSQKKTKTPYSCPYLHHILTDLKKFTGTLSRKFSVKIS